MKRVLLLCAVAGCGGVPMRKGECHAYIDCYERTAGAKGSLDSTYGPGGSCWTTTAAAADSCMSACKTAIASLQSAYPDAGCKD